MRHISRLSVLVIALMTPGCSDKVARDYAKQLAATLKKYQASVGDQIRQQMKSYEQIAKWLEAGREEDTTGHLETERLENVTELKDDLLLVDPRTRLELNESRLRDRLMVYARRDFENSKASMTAELDAYKKFLAGLQSLDQDAANVTSLVKLLTDLSEKRSPVSRLKEAVKFGEAVKDNVNKLQCAALTSQETDIKGVIAELTKKLASAGEDKPALEKALESAKKQLANIAAQKASHQCAAS